MCIDSFSSYIDDQVRPRAHFAKNKMKSFAFAFLVKPHLRMRILLETLSACRYRVYVYIVHACLGFLRKVFDATWLFLPFLFVVWFCACLLTVFFCCRVLHRVSRVASPSFGAPDGEGGQSLLAAPPAASGCCRPATFQNCSASLSAVSFLVESSRAVLLRGMFATSNDAPQLSGP